MLIFRVSVCRNLLRTIRGGRGREEEGRVSKGEGNKEKEEEEEEEGRKRRKKRGGQGRRGGSRGGGVLRGQWVGWR